MAGRKHRRAKRRADGAGNAVAASRPTAEADPPEPPPRGAVLVDRARLAPSTSYGAPDVVSRGYSLDRPVRGVDCDIAQVWTAAQQQWWYEVAKGFVYSFAKRCRGCRQARRARRGGGAGGGAAGGGAP